MKYIIIVLILLGCSTTIEDDNWKPQKRPKQIKPEDLYDPEILREIKYENTNQSRT